jgi:holo-[acyl-carrier protein] synthase
MPDVLVRDVPKKVLDGLKKRAKGHGRSLQQELRMTLAELSEEQAPDIFEQVSEIRERIGRSAPLQTDSVEPIREARDSRPGLITPAYMTTSLGIDMIEIDRIRAALRRRPRLTGRLFTEREREYCDRRADPAPHYAARFAAKEATAKASGRWLRWHDVEVLNDGDGRPHVLLYGEAAALARTTAGGGLLVSLSHSRDYAVACVLLVAPQEIACQGQNLPPGVARA